ncbi:MAG: GspE/PulE family protein, partial [bacterium]
RIDGVLNDIATLDKEMWPRLISRLKQVARVKINVNDRPQDGRFSIRMKDVRIDVRVSTLPTAFGESVVIRLLMPSSANLSFTDLGLSDETYKVLEREVQRPNGMIVTTGPTGSGKTTTLYSILKKLNNADTKIITIEDPIEYELQGINQSAVTEKYTFAQGLRSIVRQDPDVIMVGEIRDLDTAEIAIQAALTGHLVLSTIHTNDAFGTIPRFLSMGAKPYLLAPALNCCIGQRLVRKNCPYCVQKNELDVETKQRVIDILNDLPEVAKSRVDMKNLQFSKSTGCEKCQGLGYKGRIGIYEIMTITPNISQAIAKGDLSEEDVRKMAKDNGVVTMVQDGIMKAIKGITSIDEIFRVVE